MPLSLIPPLFFSIFTIACYLVSYLGLPLTRTSFSFIALASLVIVTIFTRHLRPFKKAQLPCLLALLPCLLLYLLLYQGLSTYLTPPHNADAGNHFYMIARILETHSLKNEVVYAGHTLASFYPLGLYNLVAAIMSLIGSTDLLRFVYPLIWVISAIYPLSIYYFVYQVTQRHLTALVAAFVCLTFFMFPFNVFSWGGWPQIIGLTLMWFALGELYRLVHSPRLSPLPLLILLNALLLTHTSEVFSFLLLAFPVMVYHWHQVTPLLTRRWLMILLINAIILIPLIIPGFHRAVAVDTAPAVINHYAVTTVFDMLRDFQLTTTANWFFSFLFIGGFLILVNRRQYLTIIWSTVTVALIFILVVTTPVLDWLYRPTFPWLESERVYYLLAGFYSLIIGWFITSVFPKADHRGKPLATIGLLILCAMMAYVPLRRTVDNLRYFLTAYAAAAPADLRLMARNRDRCQTYLNEPMADAARYIPYLTGNHLVLNGPYQLLPDYHERLTLLTAVASEAAYPKLQALMTKYPFDCLYSGAYTINDAHPYLSLPQLMSNPHLTVLDHELGSYIFTLNQTMPAMTSAHPPVVTISATDDLSLHSFFLGDLGTLEQSASGVPYRTVGQQLTFYTQLPLHQVTITGQAASIPAPTCQVLVNNQYHQDLQFSDSLAAVTINNLHLTGHQSQITIDCPTSPAFMFTEISLK